MTSNSNEQDLVFKARFEDDASEDIKSLDEDVQGLDNSMGGLSLSAVGAGLAMFGVGVGVQQVIQGAVESHKSLVATKALIQLLPEAAQVGLADLAPFYTEIGNLVAATRNEVEETAVAITRAAGDQVPSLEQIAFAYDLAAATGADMATAADVVGFALQGNLGPLNDLLDPSGRNYVSLEGAMSDLKDTATEAKTPIDDVTKALRRQSEEIATTEGQLDFLFGSLIQTKDAWNALFEVISKGTAGGESTRDIGSAGQILDVPTQTLVEQGAFGVGAAGAGAAFLGVPPVSIGITINGDVDSAQRLAVIMRQVELQIRNIYRGGINTFVDSRMFPN